MGATNICLLPEKKLRSLVVRLQDLVMAQIIQLRTPVVGQMLPANVILKPDVQSKDSLSYTAVDVMSGLPLGTLTISGTDDIPKALAKIQMYQIKGDAEPQGGGYSLPVARPAKPKP
jgi:hypothetical protein